jgi:hypothetical protein
MSIDLGNGLDQCQPRAYRPLCIVLVRLRVAKISKDAIAHELGDKTT